jgi:hypothetical protein
MFIGVHSRDSAILANDATASLFVETDFACDDSSVVVDQILIAFTRDCYLRVREHNLQARPPRSGSNIRIARCVGTGDDAFVGFFVKY